MHIKHIISLWKKCRFNAGAGTVQIFAQLGCSGANFSWSSCSLVQAHVGPRHSVYLFHLDFHSFGWVLFLYCPQNALQRTVCQKASAKFHPCTAISNKNKTLLKVTLAFWRLSYESKRNFMIF